MRYTVRIHPMDYVSVYYILYTVPLELVTDELYAVELQCHTTRYILQHVLCIGRG